MSGHSKWSTIKHKKAKVDAQRGVSFQKFSREIIMAAKLGGPDPSGNFRLRTAIERAKQAGLPNDNIKRAIDKGAGNSASDNFEEITYEGYANGGVAVFIEAMTDNRNRTAGDVRSYFTKFQGNLAESGCVGWMFKKAGLILFEKNIDFDTLFDAGVSAGADDIEEDDENFRVITAPENLQSVAQELENNGFNAISAELTRIPENTVEVNDVQTATLILKLIDKLEEHDDVQNVYANFDIADEILESIQ